MEEKVAEEEKKEEPDKNLIRQLNEKIKSVHKKVEDGKIKVKQTMQVEKAETELEALMIAVGPSTVEKVDKLTR